MAGRIPQDFLDLLLNRTDIVELIDSRVPLRKAGRNYSSCCPFHAEKTPSFTVSADKQFYHCFGCGAHGNAISFLIDYEQLEFRDAVEDLAKLAGIDLPETTAASPTRQHTGLLAVNQAADQFFRQQLRSHPQRERAIDYLRERGLDGETVKTFGIGYAPAGWSNLLSHLRSLQFSAAQLLEAGLVVAKETDGQYDRFRDRIMFPIRDRRGQTIAFGGRTIDGDTPPKYMNSPETPLFHKGRELYGLYEARSANRKLERLIVVEGYMDVVALTQSGLSHAVATLGTATSADHVERLFRSTPELVFCFDGDRAGREAAWRALEHTLSALRDGRKAQFLFLPDGEDPDSVVRSIGADGFAQRISETAIPLAEYLFAELGGKLDLRSIEGRARLVELTLPLLEKVPPGALRDLMREQLSEMSKLPTERLRLSADPAPSSPQFTVRDTQVKKSLPRYTIALLLAQPGLAAKVGDITILNNLTVPGLSLLIELIEILRRQPNLTTAALLERYRDSEFKRVLERLACWQPELASELLEAEFLGNIGKLMGIHADEHRLLLDKATRGELNGEEIEQLRKLGQRQAPIAP